MISLISTLLESNIKRKAFRLYTKENEMQKGILIIISGPSGVGKTTIAEQILQKCASLFSLKKIVTYTTRTPRATEVDGKDYHFISKDEFLNKIKTNFFFEQTIYNENYYGTPNLFGSLTKVGISCLVVTDRTVAQQVKKEFPTALLFWILPPSLEALKTRLTLRKSEAPEIIDERIKIAKEELAIEEKAKAFDFHIVNSNLQETIETITSIIKKQKSKENI